MSSGVDSGGFIAAAVALPVGVAFGAGWLAWQAGKLLVEINKTVDMRIIEKKREREEEVMHRKRLALAAHSQLVDMCRQLLSQIDENSTAARVRDFTEFEQLRADLHDICNEDLPEDVIQIESLNSLGFLKLEKIAARQKYLFGLQMEGKSTELYRGLSVADLMLDMKVTMATMKIQATNGKDIRAIDPVVLERVKLNEKLGTVTARTLEALKHIGELSSGYGLSVSSSTWFRSCFNGVDEQIKRLYMPSTSNAELKKGISRLENLLEQYDMLLPSIESDQKKFSALYQVYVAASKALGESIVSIKSFNSVEALEERLLILKKRSERAKGCAEIYQKLGRAAYICYAWDQELRALGYSVHTRRYIEQIIKCEPQYAQYRGNRIPFYHWNNDDLTQLYSMTSECSLQVIIHDDGSVTMKAISDADDDMAKAVQTEHCSRLGQLHENLRKNWFIMYDYQETASPNEITLVKDWFASKDSAWKSERGDVIIAQRKKGKMKGKQNKFSKGEGE